MFIIYSEVNSISVEFLWRRRFAQPNYYVVKTDFVVIGVRRRVNLDDRFIELAFRFSGS